MTAPDFSLHSCPSAFTHYAPAFLSSLSFLGRLLPQDLCTCHSSAWTGWEPGYVYAQRTSTQWEADLRGSAGLVPDHLSKANTAIKWSHKFWFPSVCKSCVHYCSLLCATVLYLKKKCACLNFKILYWKKCYHLKTGLPQTFDLFKKKMQSLWSTIKCCNKITTRGK